MSFKNSSDSYRLLYWLFGGIFLVVLAFGLILWWQRTGWAPGPFGDSFGALNTLFSGLGFAAFFFALTMQRKELKLQRDELRLQREELELTRKELSRSADAHELSVSLLEQQLVAMRSELNTTLKFEKATVALSDGTLRAIQYEFSNYGPYLSSVEVVPTSALDIDRVDDSNDAHMRSNDTWLVRFAYSNDMSGPLTFQVRYTILQGGNRIKSALNYDLVAETGMVRGPHSRDEE